MMISKTKISMPDPKFDLFIVQTSHGLICAWENQMHSSICPGMLWLYVSYMLVNVELKQDWAHEIASILISRIYYGDWFLLINSLIDNWLTVYCNVFVVDQVLTRYQNKWAMSLNLRPFFLGGIMAAAGKLICCSHCWSILLIIQFLVLFSFMKFHCSYSVIYLLSFTT